LLQKQHQKQNNNLKPTKAKIQQSTSAMMQYQRNSTKTMSTVRPKATNFTTKMTAINQHIKETALPLLLSTPLVW
jgi:hypothetical protein